MDVEWSHGWTKSYRPFERMISRLLRLIDETPSGPLRAALKRASRSIYGKLAQGRSQDRLIHRDQLEQGMRVEDGQIDVVIGWWGEWALCRVLLDEYPDHVCPVWAGQVTSALHLRLDSAIACLEDAGARPIYCDTDGVWVAHDRALDLSEVVEIGQAPGQWRVDCRATWMAVWAPKRYLTSSDKGAWSGVPVEAQRKAWATGVAVLDRRTTIRESVASGVQASTRMTRMVKT